MRNMSCAVIAEPAACFPWGYDEEDEGCGALRLLLLNRISLLTVEGIREYHVALDDGFGLYVAELVHSLREAGNMSELICYPAWEEQASKWHPDLRERYFNILAACTELVKPAAQSPTCELDAALNAIDKAGIVLAVCAGEQPRDKTFAAALRYAQRTGRSVQCISLPREI